MQDTLYTFKNLISREFKVELEQVTLNTRFREDFNTDSLDLIEFMLQVEHEFNIKLENEVLQDLKTVGDAYEFLLKKIEERNN